MSDEQQAPPPPPPSDPPPPPPPSASTPPPPPAGAPSSGGPVSANRTPMIVLAYLWLLALIPFLLEKEDQEVRWHAKHGLVLVAGEFVVWIVSWIFFGIVDAVIGSFGCISLIVYLVLMLAFIGLHIACIVQALGGKRLLIPGVSEFADKF